MKRLGFFGKCIYILNVLFAFFLFIGSIAPFITWKFLSFLSFLSLIVPYLVFSNILFMVYWIVKGKRLFLTSCLILLFGYLTQGTFIKFFNSNETIIKDDISILTFNSHGSHGVYWSRKPSYGDEIVNFIKDQDSDIVCFQEFDTKKQKSYTQYPYIYRGTVHPQGEKVSQAILSKYPIIAKGSLDFPKTPNNAIYADVVIKEDTIRIYNLHLQSLRVRPGSIKREETKRLFGRLNNSFSKQQLQAQLVREHIETSSYKSIVCGDFNNTQFSSVYRTIKGNMNDTFQEWGRGLGSTYSFKFLPFRIDFILMDDNLEVSAHKNFSEKLSDHLPIMASFRLKE